MTETTMQHKIANIVDENFFTAQTQPHGPSSQPCRIFCRIWYRRWCGKGTEAIGRGGMAMSSVKWASSITLLAATLLTGNSTR